MKNEKIIELLSRSIENLTNTLVLLTDENKTLTPPKEEFIKNINEFKYGIIDTHKSIEENNEIPNEKILKKEIKINQKEKNLIEVDFEASDPFGKLDINEDIIDDEPEIFEDIIDDEPEIFEENITPDIVPRHKFPEALYHSSGIKLTPYEGVPIYQPDFILNNNQALFGVQGEWNVVVNYVDGKYITQHPQDHFNDVELKLNE